MRFTLCILPCLLFWALSCTAQKPVQIVSLNLDEHHVLLLLDSTTAAHTLLQDTIDHFFERVTASEMSIQMKKTLEPGQTRDEILPAFQDFLRRDVEGFFPEETVRVSGVMQEVFNTCNSVAPDILPDTLILIKTKGNHYGASVYYTRANYIVIPADVLEEYNPKAFTSTMYHELFHVYSRLHPEKRKQLYRLIGFERIGLDHLHLPEALAARVLYNPDGVDFAQKITLDAGNGNTTDAIPVIYANHVGFQAGKREFFGYLEFNLFQIKPDGDGNWTVITGADGYSSTLNLRELPDYFRQIKDNTGYIIHPDEILADNFAFLMQGKKNPAVTSKFSEGGKQLITDMEAVLR